MIVNRARKRRPAFIGLPARSPRTSRDTSTAGRIGSRWLRAKSPRRVTLRPVCARNLVLMRQLFGALLGVLRAPAIPKLAAAAIATRSATYNRFRMVNTAQAADRKCTALGIGITLVSRGSSSVSQISRSALASPSINRSLWKGVGVMRSRSVPLGTVG